MKAPLIACAAALAACSGEAAAGSGKVSVLLEAEEVVTEGIEAGDSAEAIRDGWSVKFDRFVTTIGNIQLQLATDTSVVARAPEVYAVDLTRVASAGLPLWEIDGVRAGHWEFAFETQPASSTTLRHESVTPDVFDSLMAQHLTYVITGSLTKPDGQSCPPRALATPGDREPNGQSAGGNPCYDTDDEGVKFSFAAAVPTLFGPCELDGVPGFSVADEAQQTVAATLHGDHLFFNGFPEGDEGGITRRAQWLADSDLDLDGTVTTEELSAIAPAELPQIDDDFQLGGSPVTPLDNMLDYVRGQLMTQGHMNGEGECTYNSLPSAGGGA